MTCKFGRILKGLSNEMDLAFDYTYDWFEAQIEDGAIFKIF